MQVEYSVVTNTKNDLGKQFLLQDGNLVSNNIGNLFEGEIVTERTEFKDLLQTFDALETNQAILLGVSEGGEAKVCTAKDKAKLGTGEWISRSLEFIEWPKGEKLLLLDIDKFSGDRNDLIKKIKETMPELEKSAMLVRPSASSCIWNGDKELVGEKSWHVFVAVQANQDMKGLKETLQERAWLSGTGEIEVTKNGAVSVKQLFDIAVVSPERLVYEGASPMFSPLTSKRSGNAHYIEGQVTPLIHPVSHEEKYKVKKLQNTARKDPSIIKKIAENKKLNIEEIAHAMQADGKSAREIEQYIKSYYASDHETLVGSLVNSEGILFGDMLWNPEEYDGKTMRHPREGYEKDGATIARFEAEMKAFKGEPGIRSFAHGQQFFFIRYDLPYIEEKLIEASENGGALKFRRRVKHIWERMVWTRDEEAAEQQEFRLRCKQYLKMSMKDFDTITKRVKPLAIYKEKIDRDKFEVPDHSEGAKAFLKIIASKSGSGAVTEAVSAGTSIFSYNFSSGLWQGRELDSTKVQVGTYLGGKLCSTDSHYKAVGSHAFFRINHPEFFKDAPQGIACPNGFIQLGNEGRATIKPYNPDFRQTSKITITGNIITDESVKALDGYDQLNSLQMPRIMKQFYMTFGQEELPEDEVRQQVNNWQKLCGAVLAGMACAGGKAAFLRGGGGNGKNVICNLLAGCMEEDSITASDPTGWDNPTKLYPLIGKRLNLVGELPSNKMPSASFKNIVTGDAKTQVRKLYSDPVDAVIDIAHIFSSNHALRCDDKTTGFTRRLLFFHCPHSFVNEDTIPHIDKQLLQEEGEFLISWIIEGARKFALAGYKYGESAVHTRFLNEFLKTDDVYRSFLDGGIKHVTEHIAFGNIEVASVNGQTAVASGSLEDLYQLCERYVDYMGLEEKIVKVKLAKKLESMGYKQTSKAGKKVVYEMPMIKKFVQQGLQQV